MLLHFVQCVSTLEKSPFKLELDWVFFIFIYTTCPSSLKVCMQRKSKHLYTHSDVLLISTAAITIHVPLIQRVLSWDKWVIFLCKCLAKHENHFIIPSVSSAVYPKDFSGLATEGLGRVMRPEILVNIVHRSHTKTHANADISAS